MIAKSKKSLGFLLVFACFSCGPECTDPGLVEVGIFVTGRAVTTESAPQLKIRIDGKNVGTGIASSYCLVKGPHTVEITAGGFHKITQRIDVLGTTSYQKFDFVMRHKSE